MKLTPRHSPTANVTATSNGWRMDIPAGEASAFRLAQLDNYSALPRNQFPSRPPVAISLRARASSDSTPGTWGFGFWNDPFEFSLGVRGRPFRLPALPNAAWFFHASEENYLSFSSVGRNDTSYSQSIPPSDDSAGYHPAPQNLPGNGFMAQSFRSPAFDLRLLLTAVLFPFSRKAARRQLSRIIREDGVRVQADPTEWHHYRLDWSPKRVVCEVDNVRVLETSVSPRPPLGMVIWIDNQFAAYTPEGKIGFGVLSNPEPAWIEISDLEIRPGF